MKYLLIICLTLTCGILKAQEEKKPTIFRVVEKQPEFPGGFGSLMTFISDNLQYPS